jgi:hypothetical protein
MSMKSRCTCLLFCLSLASISFATASSANESGEGYIKMFDKKLEEAQRANACKERLRRLEPPEPVKLQDPPFLPEGAFPSVVLPINEIVQTGKKLPYRTIVSLTSYQRPAYEEHWHSTVGRWSYMPNRIHCLSNRSDPSLSKRKSSRCGRKTEKDGSSRDHHQNGGSRACKQSGATARPVGDHKRGRNRLFAH